MPHVDPCPSCLIRPYGSDAGGSNEGMFTSLVRWILGFF